MTDQPPFIYQQLIDALKADRVAPTQSIISALVDLEVKVRTAAYINGQLRSGLQFYAPGPFWTEVLDKTKASEDLGKHAEWILRLTDPEAA